MEVSTVRHGCSLRAKAGCNQRRHCQSQARWLGRHEGNGFGLNLSDSLGGQGAALSPVQHLVADLVCQSREFLGRRHPREQCDLATVG